MKLSVIIPVFNQPKLIVRAINSIPQRDDIEIIVVNDGSTDSTLEMVKNIDREIVLISYELNRGVGFAENQAFDVAKGEYLMRLDSDDYLYTDTFEQSLESLDGTDIIYYNLKNNQDRIYIGNPTNARKYHSGALKYIRREFLGNIRNDEVRFMEDRLLFDRLVENNPTEKTTGLVVAHYNYPREDSLVNRKAKEMNNEFDIVFFTII